MQTFYTVKPGDTLSSIAERWEVPLASLAAANRITNPDRIEPGQQLSVPPGVASVRVKPGDSVYSLAQAFGVPTSVIIGANRLHPPYTIYVDQRLSIPPGVPYYTVQPGDTLFALAERYNVTTYGAARPELIREANRLPSDQIVVSMRLVIPYAPPGGSGRIAFVSDRAGTFDVWTYDPASGAVRAIGGGQADPHTTPYWSPDSRRIAFVGKLGIVFVVDALGAEGARQIDQVEPYTALSWSPDGTRLAYVKNDRIAVYNVETFAHGSIAAPGAKAVSWFPTGGDRLFYSAAETTGDDAFYEVRLDGAVRRRLPVGAVGPKNDAALSPDGAYALYTSPGASISLAYVANLATGDVYRLTGGPMAKNYDPRWSPDGGSIAYSSNEYDERKGYYSTVRVERPQGGAQRIVAVSDCYATPVSWSPDGRSLLYLSGCGTGGYASELWVADVAVPAPVLAVGGAAAGQSGAITAARWSPRPIREEPLAVYSSATYKVRFAYPASWRRISESRAEGADGFFEVSAVSSELPFQALCREVANHPLQPFGAMPRIAPGRVQGREACYIFPSADQASELRSQSALLAQYPEPAVVDGVVYPYLILWADEAHLASIASGLTFI